MRKYRFLPTAMLEQNPYESSTNTTVPDQAAVDRLIKIRRTLTIGILFILLLGGLDAAVAVQQVFQQASETVSFNPAFLASELSRACQFLLWATLGAGALWCVRLWVVFRLRFLGVEAGPALFLSHRYFKQRLNRMLDEEE